MCASAIVSGWKSVEFQCITRHNISGQEPGPDLRLTHLDAARTQHSNCREQLVNLIKFIVHRMSRVSAAVFGELHKSRGRGHRRPSHFTSLSKHGEEGRGLMWLLQIISGASGTTSFTISEQN